MLKTLGASTAKLNGLIQRLGRYGNQREPEVERVELERLVGDVAARFEPSCHIHVSVTGEGTAIADREGLEQALAHLIQNAFDASPANAPVCVSIHSDHIGASIEIVDVGEGMDPAFLRDKLYAPFVSSKADGFGIGALEARELVRAMGGRLLVQSRVGLGTRFTIELAGVASHLVDKKLSREAA